MEKMLADAELHMRNVASAIVSGEPQALSIAATSLRLAALALAQALPRPDSTGQIDSATKRRVRILARALAQQRESLLRRSALIDRALHALVPASRVDSYAPGGSTYGTAGRPTGSFRMLSA